MYQWVFVISYLTGLEAPARLYRILLRDHYLFLRKLLPIACSLPGRELLGFLRSSFVFLLLRKHLAKTRPRAFMLGFSHQCILFSLTRGGHCDCSQAVYLQYSGRNTHETTEYSACLQSLRTYKQSDELPVAEVVADRPARHPGTPKSISSQSGSFSSSLRYRVKHAHSWRLLPIIAFRNGR